ncbi:MAG TPA: hypothetical protein VF753_21790 [Terriglobales bacterium]
MRNRRGYVWFFLMPFSILLFPGWRPTLGETSQSSVPSAAVGQQQQCRTGGPIYCSRTDLVAVPLPAPLPNVGNLTGANTIITDSAFSNPIVRVTDWKTEGSGGRNDNFAIDCGGSAEINFMNADSTRFFLCDAGGGIIPFIYDPSTMQATRMYTAKFPATNGMRILAAASSGEWSFQPKNIMYDVETGSYQAGTPVLKSYDFGNQSVPPTPETLYNFSSNANCVPASAGATHWVTDVTVSHDDQTFSTAFSLTGGQGTGVWVVVWNRTNGCRWLNTQTGEVGGQWGTLGNISIFDRFYIHNSRLSLDGNWVKIGFQNCITNCVAGVQNYFWEIGTSTVLACTTASNCLGHSAVGYKYFINSPTTPKQQSQLIRPLASVSNQTEIWTQGPPNHIPWDNHQSWQNATPSDDNPYLSSSSTGVPVAYAWDNEIDGFSTNGSGKVYRFAHTFATGNTPFFSGANAIGSVSRDGKFFAWCSDWEGTLGSTKGSYTCTIGSNCRSDVFIVLLK